MTTPFLTVGSLVLAAALESGGDALMRHGLTRGPRAWVVAGALVLALYGVVVNADRRVDFSTLMGTYIAVFFVVSQAIAVAFMGDRPAPTTLAGGILIIAGGALVQFGKTS